MTAGRRAHEQGIARRISTAGRGSQLPDLEAVDFVRPGGGVDPQQGVNPRVFRFLRRCVLTLLLLGMGLGLPLNRVPSLRSSGLLEAAEKASPQILVVRSRALAPHQTVQDAFLKGLREAGFAPQVESLTLDAADAAKALEPYGRRPPDLVLAFGSTVAATVQKQLPAVPVVFAMVIEPGRSGLPAVGARGGGSLTGVTMDIPVKAQLEALKTLVPGIKRVGTLYGPTTRAESLAEMGETARPLGLSWTQIPVKSERDVPGAIATLCREVEGVIALPDATVFSTGSTQYILLHTLREGRPFVGLLDAFVSAGALASIGLSYEDLGAQAAGLATRILKGESAGSLPVQAPRKTRLLLNLRTARRLGVTVPAGLPNAEVVVP